MADSRSEVARNPGWTVLRVRRGEQHVALLVEYAVVNLGRHCRKKPGLLRGQIEGNGTASAIEADAAGELLRVLNQVVPPQHLFRVVVERVGDTHGQHG